MKPVRSRVATSVAPHIGGAASDLLLKVTPPRVPRDLVVRPRLKADDAQFHGRAAIIVQAPAGFGKTSLLAQWRREHLAHGRIVAWLSAQAEDNPQRFVRSLALAVRIGSGRPTFGHTLLVGAALGGLEGITSWLAEVAQSALDIVLMVDSAEQLPPASRETLTYLLHNAPANLRVEVAARGDHDLAVADLVNYGQCVVIGTTLLRFRLEETIGLARARFGTRIDADTAAQLHELTEGWPLGLQLALAATGQRSDLRTAFKAASARAGDLHDYFADMLVKNLAADDAAFLARVAIVDNLHPDLCRALTDAPEAPKRLARLARETPIFVAGEDSDWLHMHSLARDVLRARSNLTATEQAELHARASRWYAQQDMLEDAARHALAAGQRAAAFDLAERCLYDALMRRGHQSAVLEWVGRLPGAELDKRPRLLLAAAWALALSERHQEAERLVARILKHADTDAALRCECALILSGAAAFADDPDHFAELHDPWSNRRRFRTQCCYMCTRTATHSERCLRAIPRKPGCISSKRRGSISLATSATPSATLHAGVSSSRRFRICGKDRFYWQRACCGPRWRALMRILAAGIPSPACWPRCSLLRSGNGIADPTRPRCSLTGLMFSNAPACRKLSSLVI